MLASLDVSASPWGDDPATDPAIRPLEWNDDDVVLLDEAGAAVGVDSKSAVHHAQTPLHLAFSCYIFDADDRLLVTQRALGKPSFAGVVTNSCCGHPRPGEALEDAVRRRALSEVGISLDDLWLVLPEFRYRAVSDTGMVENEMCPVFAARTSSTDLALDPTEVEWTEWVPWASFAASVLDGSRTVSTWCTEQVPLLLALGATPADWPAASPDLLPPAARL